MDNINFKKVQVKTYDGTIKGAKELFNDLDIESNNYFYDIYEGTLLIHSKGILYRTGDSYYCPIEEDTTK